MQSRRQGLFAQIKLFSSPFLPKTIISPGSISLIKFTFIVWKAHSSEAKTKLISSRPKQRGLIPNRSLTPITLSLNRIAKLKAPFSLGRTFIKASIKSFSGEDKVIGVRDRFGIRPLCFGRD